MSAVSMNEAAKKTAQLENAKEARPPGGAPQEEHLPRKIFVCSPYRPTSQDEKCRKDELEANIRRAKMACRILSTLGFLPLAPHLYFTQFLKDEEKQERNTGIQLGMQWLEEADELWVFGSTVSEGMAAEIKRAHELQKKVRNLPEPGRVVELLLKNISEQYHVPLNDKKTEGQQEAAESEEDNGEQEREEHDSGGNDQRDAEGCQGGKGSASCQGRGKNGSAEAGHADAGTPVWCSVPFAQHQEPACPHG